MFKLTIHLHFIVLPHIRFFLFQFNLLSLAHLSLKNFKNLLRRFFFFVSFGMTFKEEITQCVLLIVEIVERFVKCH